MCKFASCDVLGILTKSLWKLWKAALPPAVLSATISGVDIVIHSFRPAARNVLYCRSRISKRTAKTQVKKERLEELTDL